MSTIAKPKINFDLILLNNELRFIMEPLSKLVIMFDLNILYIIIEKKQYKEN